MDASSGDAANGAKELAKLIKIHVGSSCAIDVVEPESLERSMGKLKRIFDLRNS